MRCQICDIDFYFDGEDKLETESGLWFTIFGFGRKIEGNNVRGG